VHAREEMGESTERCVSARQHDDHSPTRAEPGRSTIKLQLYFQELAPPANSRAAELSRHKEEERT
jgi:hypothetical protein